MPLLQITCLRLLVLASYTADILSRRAFTSFPNHERDAVADAQRFDVGVGQGRGQPDRFVRI